MGWFTRKEREPDAIDLICQSLKDRYWEWTETTNKGNTILTNLSGPVVMIGGYQRLQDVYECWLGQEMCQACDDRTARRLYAAYQQHLAARLSSKKGSFDASAKAMAQAVLTGDMVAARALADRVQELAMEAPDAQ